MLMLTAQRRDEVADMAWSELSRRLFHLDDPGEPGEERLKTASSRWRRKFRRSSKPRLDTRATRFLPRRARRFQRVEQI